MYNKKNKTIQTTDQAKVKEVHTYCENSESGSCLVVASQGLSVALKNLLNPLK